MLNSLAVSEHEAAYHEVDVYSMGRPGFILQHVADAFAVQAATAESKPIGVVFGLAGLYLRVEAKFSGRQVQRAHRELARTKREWPRIALPPDRGEICVGDVLAARPGHERDFAIDDWCRSVWFAFATSHETNRALLREYRIT
jgi:hypothetical protein